MTALDDLLKSYRETRRVTEREKGKYLERA